MSKVNLKNKTKNRVILPDGTKFLPDQVRTLESEVLGIPGVERLVSGGYLTQVSDKAAKIEEESLRKAEKKAPVVQASPAKEAAKVAQKSPVKDSETPAAKELPEKAVPKKK